MFAALDHGEYKDLVHQPVLLKIIFERYLELMETRLIPALEKNAAMQATPPQSQASEHNPGFAFPQDQQTGPTAATDATGPQKPAANVTTSRHNNPASQSHHTSDCDTTGKFRRSVPRYKRRLPLQYKILGRDLTPHKAYSRDIGAMGLFIMSNRPEKTGDQIRIDIEVPGAGMTQLEAIVVWTKYVPHNLRSMDYSGFGVRISKATESWYNFFVLQEE